MKTILCALVLSALPSQAQTPDPTWKKLEFLLGKWTGAAGEKETPHGAGQGGFSFEPELNQKIIVRRNHAEYASGVKHDDLMIIYIDNDTPRAIYFDTHSRTKNRQTDISPDGTKVVFESDGTQPGPKYRLTYWMEGPQMKGTFEIAAPGAEYKTYLSWTSKRD
jgi:hypothetical protein